MDHIQEIVTGNPTVIKMVVSFNRGARGQNALRQILAPVVKEIMDDKALNIKTDPVDIYKSWVNQMESQTGEARCVFNLFDMKGPHLPHTIFSPSIYSKIFSSVIMTNLLVFKLLLIYQSY